jgi:hypothetical protein
MPAKKFDDKFERLLIYFTIIWELRFSLVDLYFTMNCGQKF